jgi:predicted NUDIX family NTP pyrophosphohydrolase
MPKKSAGLLVFRNISANLQVLLVHPGGPFWAKKDEGSWSIPKGEIEGDEEPLAVAMREFIEETGSEIAGSLIALDPLRQPGGKIIYAWALKGDFDADKLRSNTFLIEWPPKSGRQQEFPEVDRAEWFSIETAMKKILRGQQRFITQLIEKTSQSRQQDEFNLG